MYFFPDKEKSKPKFDFGITRFLIENNLFFFDPKTIITPSSIVLGIVFSLFFSQEVSAQWTKKQIEEIPLISDAELVTKTTGYMGGSGYIYRTGDGGDTWEVTPDFAGDSLTASSVFYYTTIEQEFGFVSEEVGFCIGRNWVFQSEVIFKTIDGGDNWQVQHNVFADDGDYESTDPTLTDLFVFSEQKVFVVGHNGRILRTNDGGANWVTVQTQFGTGLNAITFIDNDNGYIGGDKVFLATKNGGADWTTQETEYNMADLHFFNEFKGLAVTVEGEIIFTEDAGQNWTTYRYKAVDGFDKIEFVTEETGYIQGKHEILKTVDGGQTWFALLLAENGERFTSISFEDDKAGLLTSNEYFKAFVYKTTNGGDFDIVEPVIESLSSEVIVSEGEVEVYGANLNQITGVLYGDVSLNFSIIDNATLVFTLPSDLTIEELSFEWRGGVVVYDGNLAISTKPVVDRLPGDSFHSRGFPLYFSGVNLDSVAEVRLNNTTAVDFEIISKISLKVDIPADAYSGNTQVIFYNQFNREIYERSTVLIVGSPRLDKITVDYASEKYEAAKGQTIRIDGNNLINLDEVRLGNVPVPFDITDNSRVSFVVPDDAVTGHITLKNPVDSVKSPFRLRILGRPAIHSVSQSTAAYGDTLTIKGENFKAGESTTTVRVGDKLTFNAKVIDEKTIKFLYEKGSGKISVSTSTGEALSELTVSHNGETKYGIASISPEIMYSGRRIVIRGFWPQIDSITYAGYNITGPLSDRRTSFFIDVPENLIEGVTKSVFKYHRLGSVVLTSDSVSYESAPVPYITSATPQDVSIGEKVSLEGFHFNKIDSVLIGNKKCVMTILASDKINFWVPEGSQSGRIRVFSEYGESEFEEALIIKPRSELKSRIYNIYTATYGFIATKLASRESYVLLGSNLEMVDSISVGNLKITDFEAVSNDSLIFNVPWVEAAVAGSNKTFFLFSGEDVTTTTIKLEALIPDPTITAVSPLSGPRGTTIEVNFEPLSYNPPQAVYINGIKTIAYHPKPTDLISRFNVVVPTQGDVNGKISYNYYNRIIDTGYEFTLDEQEYCEVSVATFDSFTYGAGPSLDGIERVQFNEIDNTSDEGEHKYNDFTDQATDIYAGYVYPLTVNAREYKVYIDWNADKQFDEASELVMSSDEGSGTKMIRVPTDIAVGKSVRMRVLKAWTAPAEFRTMEACGGRGVGEAEDYTLHLKETTGNVLDSFYPKEAGSGAYVYINGAGFDALTAVSVNGTSASFEVINSSLLKMQVPAESKTGPLELNFDSEALRSSEPLEVADDFTKPQIYEIEDRRIALDSHSLENRGDYRTEIYNVTIGDKPVTFGITGNRFLSYYPDKEVRSGPLCIYGKGGKTCTTEALLFPMVLYTPEPNEGKAGDSIRLPVKSNAASVTRLLLGTQELDFEAVDDSNIIFQVPENGQTAQIFAHNDDGVGATYGTFQVNSDYCQPEIVGPSVVQGLQLASLDLGIDDIDPGYNDLRHLTVDMAVGEYYSLERQLDPDSDDVSFRVFIDWNHDFDFGDAYECFYGALQMPLSAAGDTYTMRVVVDSKDVFQVSCRGYQVFDFRVRVVSPLGVEGDVEPFSPGFSSDFIEIIEGQVINFTDESIGEPDSWEWQFEGGEPATSTEQNPQGIVYPNAGRFNVSLSIKKGEYVQSTNEVVDYVLVKPMLVTGFEATAIEVVAGTQIDFVDVTSGDPLTWLWSFEGADVTSSDKQNPQNIKYSTPGTYSVSLTTTNNDEENTKTVAGYITVHPELIAGFSTDEREVVVGSSVRFSDQSEGNPNRWEWSFDAEESINASEQNPDVVFTSPGVVSVALTVFGNIQESTKLETDYVMVYPKLVSDFKADTTQLEMGSSINFADVSTGDPESWQWEFEGAEPSTSTDRNPSGVVYENPGTYKVTLTTQSNIQENTKTEEGYITVHLVTGIDNGANNHIRIYPNPADDIINIRSDIFHRLKRYEIFNINGVEVAAGDVRSDLIDISFLTPGLYSLRILGEPDVYTMRFVKNK